MEDNEIKEKVYSNFERKEVDKPKEKKVKKKKSSLWILVALILMFGFIGYVAYSNYNTVKEVTTFCKQFNMSKGDCGGMSELCCYVKLNDNLIQRFKIEKIDNKWMFIQEGLK